MGFCFQQRCYEIFMSSSRKWSPLIRAHSALCCWSLGKAGKPNVCKGKSYTNSFFPPSFILDRSQWWNYSTPSLPTNRPTRLTKQFQYKSLSVCHFKRHVLCWLRYSSITSSVFCQMAASQPCIFSVTTGQPLNLSAPASCQRNRTHQPSWSTLHIQNPETLVDIHKFQSLNLFHNSHTLVTFFCHLVLSCLLHELVFFFSTLDHI